MKLLFRTLAATLIIALLAVIAVWLAFGYGERLPDLTTDPKLGPQALELVAELKYPPGNIAVSADGRVFFTLHPDGKPEHKVLEWVDGAPVPYPDEAFQHPRSDRPFFDTVLSLRIDGQGRLWTLDFARFGRGVPRLLAFDLETARVVHEYRFPADVAGLGSMLNDFQVSPDGTRIYIAETSPLVHHPALIVYDTVERSSRRLLESHESVLPKNYVIQAPGRDMLLYGIYNMRIGVDSIALDRSGEWLYYGAVTSDRMYRIRTAHLDDETLTPEQLASHVEDFAAKTLSDGITTDDAGNVYLSDMEHSAVVRMAPDGTLTTLVKDERLRWPDGFSFGPDGYLYVTCSSLHHVLFVPKKRMKRNRPYHIFRFQPGATAAAGH